MRDGKGLADIFTNVQDLIQHFLQIPNMAVGEELIEGAEAHPITCLGTGRRQQSRQAKAGRALGR
jgi:hypothetical protein